MENKDFAPVIVFAYNRPEHLRKTLFALNQNIGAENTNLFIFIDGPKTEEAVEKNNQVIDVVREFARDSKFKNVNYHINQTNNGLANSVISGVTRIINRYGKVIVVEDDIVSTPYFLKYMNEALEYYYDDHRIWSISGYTPQLPSLKDYDKDVYFEFRGCSWGWATWKNRWDTVDWKCSDYGTKKYFLLYKRLFTLGGYDLPNMLTAQMNGKIDSWAVRWCYNQARHAQLTVYPRCSLVENIGFDGSGVHCGETHTYDVDIREDFGINVSFVKKNIDVSLVEQFKKIYGMSTNDYLKKILNNYTVFFLHLFHGFSET